MTESDFNTTLAPFYCIPHHAVQNEGCDSTKLRVAFDESAITISVLSLIGSVYTRHVVQRELFAILIRFRIPRFLFSTDTEASIFGSGALTIPNFRSQLAEKLTELM